MLNVFSGVLTAAWDLMLEMSPYLLLGFLAAGILNFLIPKDKIYKHFAGNDFKASFKAALFGVPLPICSCGVIPVAAYLRDKGAGKGATVSFLASTPTTGIDSILATYSLLGPLFAIIRPAAAFFAGIFGGTLTNITENSHKPKKDLTSQNHSCSSCSTEKASSSGIMAKIKNVFSYAFFDLVRDVGKWIVLGILIGGVIEFLIPGNIIEKYLGTPWLAYPLMLLVSIPMYICATGSIPIAASLILKGMTPGAGLVFLIAGPATNVATLSFTGGKLGKKTLLMYLLSIAATAVLFGLLLDLIWALSGNDTSLLTQNMQMLSPGVKTAAALLLSGLLLNALIHKIIIKPKSSKLNDTAKIKTYKIPGMTCDHCLKTIKNAVKKFPGITSSELSLPEKQLKLSGEFDENALFAVINKAGFKVEKNKE